MSSKDLKGLYEAYNEVYEEIDLITDDLIEEVVEELIQECVEFGYELDEAADVVEEAAIEYLMELNPYAPAGSKAARQYQKSTTATKRGEERKAAVSAAKEKVKAKAKGAVAAAGIAASIAKDEARRAGRAAVHAVKHKVEKKKAEVKSGVKSLIGRGLRKAAGAVGKVASKAAGAASRLGEEAQQLDEISDRRVQGMLAKREKQDKDSGGISAGHMANRRAQQAAARRNVRTGSNVKVDPILSKEEVDVFDLVLEYLLETGHAETISEAEYIMSQMDSEMIENILEDSATLSAAARRRAQEMGAKRRRTPAYKAGGNRGTGRNERAAYDLSNKQRSAAANPDTQTTRSKKPSTMDTGMHPGDYDRYHRKDPKKNPKHNANR